MLAPRKVLLTVLVFPIVTLASLSVPAEASLVNFAVVSTTGSVTFGQNADVNGTLLPSSAGHVGGYTTVSFGSNGDIDGGIFAVASGGTAITLGGSGVTQTQAVGTCNTGGGSVTGTAGCLGGTATDGTMLGEFTAAVTDANALLSGIPTHSATQTLGAITDTATITAVSGWNFIDVPSIVLGNNKTLTVNGPSDAIVVVRTSLLTLGNNTDILLGGGGLTVNNLIFDTGNTSIGVNSSDLFGTFISRSSCTLSNSFALTGALVCTGNISITNGSIVNSIPFSNAVETIPEPGTSILLLSGLAMLAVFRRSDSRT